MECVLIPAVKTKHLRRIGRRGIGRVIVTLFVIACASTREAPAQTSVDVPVATPSSATADPPTYQDIIDALVISGYASKVSVRPGETVDIQVSTPNPKFKAELVRVIHADPDPRGPGIKEIVIDVPENRDYDGKRQPLVLGSYVSIPDANALNLTSSFTIAAWIAPTTIPGSILNALAEKRTPVGAPRPQAVIAKWDKSTEHGYGLFIDETGALSVWIGGTGTPRRISTGTKMEPYAPAPVTTGPGRIMSTFIPWYFVAVTYDAVTGKGMLFQEPLKGRPNPSRAVINFDGGRSRPLATTVPLLIGAGWSEGAGQRMGGLFNGRIDSPVIFNRALSASEVEALRTKGTSTGAVAAWDFSREVSTTDVIATIGGLNGTTFNNPTRAITGHSWQPGDMNFHAKPSSFTAMHFHDDDITDAKWDTSVQFTIPQDAKSGNYAARLTDGSHVYHAVFTVLPAVGKHSDVAYLVPTLSYLAYANVATTGHYSRHNDGSPVVYSGWKRPIVNMRPYATGLRGERWPHQYEADSHLTDWLETAGYNVDYITDHDLHANPDILNDYKVVITGSHPEYDSPAMISGLIAWLNRGGRLMYMGGNGFYWVSTLAPAGLFTEVRRHDGTNTWKMNPAEHYHSTTGDYGGTWRTRGISPHELTGVGFAAQSAGGPNGFVTEGRPYDVTPLGRGLHSWVFKGVDTSKPIATAGLWGEGGPAGFEIERVEYSLGTTSSTQVLASATGFSNGYQHVIEETAMSHANLGGATNPLVRADMAIRYYPNNGAVWSSASIAWSASLSHNNYDNEVAKITKNVLDKFRSGEALPGAPTEK